MVDATHHLTRYDRMTIVWNVVDCLQQTILAGVSYSPSENHAPIIQGALSFSQMKVSKMGKGIILPVESLRIILIQIQGPKYLFNLIKIRMKNLCIPLAMNIL